MFVSPPANINNKKSNKSKGASNILKNKHYFDSGDSSDKDTSPVPLIALKNKNEIMNTESFDSENSDSEEFNEEVQIKEIVEDNITKLINSKKLFIDPFDKNHVRSNYFILTLGTHYYTQNDEIDYLLPNENNKLVEFWNGPLKYTNIVFDKKSLNYIMIEPNSSILVHTRETLGIYSNMLCHFNLHPRLILCGISAQVNFFYPGDLNKVVVLLTNNSKTKVTLPVGTKILYCTPLSCIFKNNVNMNHKYCMEFSKKWKPENMLPSSNSSGSKKNVKNEKDIKKEIKKEIKKSTNKEEQETEIEFSGFVC